MALPSLVLYNSASYPLRQQVSRTSSVSHFVNPRTSRHGVLVHTCKPGRIVCKAQRTPPTAESNVLVKLAWYASESFGNLVALFRPSAREDAEEVEQADAFQGPVPRQQAVEAIRKDFEKSYFVTGTLLHLCPVRLPWRGNFGLSRIDCAAVLDGDVGNMSTGIYEADCEFADPFVSFKGLKRFKQNVSNLGSFMEESTLKILDWQESEVSRPWSFDTTGNRPLLVPYLRVFVLH